MDGGTLSDEEVERLGLALLKLNQRMDELKGVFGLTDEDLNIDLGPLGRLRVTSAATTARSTLIA